MRPLKLTMQAYGVYLDKVVIPFENLGKSNIYLISGVTGSGKTTIFDAISFALFNQASGSIRGNNTLRSHFADDNIESFVEFIFEFRGEKYTVIRTPSYYRKKLRGEGYIYVNPKAQLTLPDSKLIIGVKEVDEYIVNLLGINASQFGQVALLAQGEFLKLLNADTQKRGEIFRNIFKTEQFLKFSNELKDKTKDLKEHFDDLKKSLTQYIFQINSSDEKIISLINSYKENDCIFNIEEFVDLLCCEIKSDEKKLHELEKGLSEINKSVSKNEIDLSKINEKNSLIDKISAYQKDFSVAVCEFELTEKEYKTLDFKNKKLDELKIEIEKQNEKINKIIQYKQYIKNLEKVESDENALLNKDFQTKKEYISLYYSYCSFLSDELDKLQKMFSSLKDNVLKENIVFNNLNIEFLSMQAGILARELKDGIECPVCGSKEHPNPARIDGNINIDSKLIEKKQKELSNLNKKLAEVSGECSAFKEKRELSLKQFNLLKEKFNINEVEKENLDYSFEEFNDKFLYFENEIKKNQDEILNIRLEKSKFISLIKSFGSEFENLDINKVEDNYKDLLGFAQNLKSEILSINQAYNSKKENIAQLKTKIDFADEQLKRYSDLSFDLDYLIKENCRLKDELSACNNNLKNLQFKINTNKNLYDLIKQKYEKYKLVEGSYLQYKILSDCASGTLKGKPRIPFEQYVQGYYLDLILHEANKHLRRMTKNQFQLLRKKEADSLQSKTGLDIEVMDYHTYKVRSTKTLSGGESFKASLALALGLSDIISCFSGAVNIDAMFIDEGFGTLDSESLELALDVIVSLSETGRLIGIISHVDDLKNRIENKIISIKTDMGSKVEINF